MSTHDDEGPGFLPEMVRLAAVIREAPPALQLPLREAAGTAVTAAHQRGRHEGAEGLREVIEDNLRRIEATAVARVVNALRAQGITLTVHDLIRVCAQLDIPLKAMPAPTREPNPEELS